MALEFGKWNTQPVYPKPMTWSAIGHTWVPLACQCIDCRLTFELF